MRWILYAVKIYFKTEKIFGCNQPKIFSKNMRGLGNTAGPGKTAKKLTKKSVLPEEECTSKGCGSFPVQAYDTKTLCVCNE